MAITDGLLRPETSFFDYGCGLGRDLALLKAQGYQVDGWDPVHRPETDVSRASIVNIGYVVNVIEDPIERRETLLRAWSITEQVLVVSARLMVEAEMLSDRTQRFSDGHLTVSNTFQKFFDQAELRDWIAKATGTSPVAAAPGVFYVFRSEQRRIEFVSSKYRRRLVVPRFELSMNLFEAHQALLGPIAEFAYSNGRLPFDEEIGDKAELGRVFGGTNAALRIVFKILDSAQVELAALTRRDDVLVYLALSRFSGRPKLAELPVGLRGDVRSFFKNYADACSISDVMLHSLSRKDELDRKLKKSEWGKKTPSALYVHKTALDWCPIDARLYEGCARAFMGDVPDANVVKLHFSEAKVSYLSYPSFDHDAHPALVSSTSVDLRTFRVKHRDFSTQANRPILHRKELFVAPDYPNRAKFMRLTAAEERMGLYEQTDRIGMSQGWSDVLAARGCCLVGHRLVKISAISEVQARIR